MRKFLAALLLALWSVPAFAQLGPGGSSLGPSGGGSGGSVPAGSLAVGVTAITGGTTTRVIYDNGGLVGEYTNTQLTALINSATSSLSGALPAFPNTTTTFFRGDGTYTALNLAAFPTQATNTVLGNATSGTAVPTALTVGTCSTASSALIWTTNTGFGCNTSITASAVAVGGITGLGTGVATALGVNVGSAGAPVTFNGALGTPSSGVATNLTSIPVANATGILPAANGGAGTISGALKGNGSGTVSQAAATDLSDYTATSWTPAITTDATVGTPAYTTQVGSYNKIGGFVSASFDIVLSGWTGSPTGNVNISGLPVATISTASVFGDCTVSVYTVTGLAALNYGITGAILPNTSTILLRQNGSTGTSVITAAQIGSTATLIGRCNYRAL